MITLWDGGMGNELAQRGASNTTDLWSARALIEAPSVVLDVHKDYISAGSDVITTNSYSTIPSYLAKEDLADRYLELTALAGQLARQAADESQRKISVNGSLPPMSESYRADLIPDETTTLPIYRHLANTLEPFVDGFVCETMSSAAEARTAATAATEAAQKRKLPVFVSWTLNEEPGSGLRSGESVEQALSAVAHLAIAGFLFNCSHPLAIDAALKNLTQLTDKPIGGYANSFNKVPKEWTLDTGTITKNDDLTPHDYVEVVGGWIEHGATLIGGCCGIGPAHIESLAKTYPHRTS